MPPLRRIFHRVEAKETKLSFEHALGKLESIVESMESGDVPLAELLARFEEGNKLLKVCEARLKDADPTKRLVVTGCLVQRYGGDLQQSLPEVDAFLGTGDGGEQD